MSNTVWVVAFTDQARTEFPRTIAIFSNRSLAIKYVEKNKAQDRKFHVDIDTDSVEYLSSNDHSFHQWQVVRFTIDCEKIE